MNTDLAKQKIDAAIASLTEARTALTDPIPAPIPDPPIVVGPSYVSLIDADFAKPTVVLKGGTVYILPPNGINLTTNGTKIVSDTAPGALNPTLKLALGDGFRNAFTMKSGLVGIGIRDVNLDLGAEVDATGVGSKVAGIHLRGSEHTLLNLTVLGGGSGVIVTDKKTSNITIDGLCFPNEVFGYGIYTQGDTAEWRHENWHIRHVIFNGSLNEHAIRLNAMFNLLIEDFFLDQRLSPVGKNSFNVKWGDQILIRNGTAFGRNWFGPLQAGTVDYDWATLKNLVVSGVKMGGTGANGSLMLEAGVVDAAFTDLSLTSNDTSGVVKVTYKAPRPDVSALFTRLKVTTKKTGTLCYGLNPNIKFVDSTCNDKPWMGGAV